MEMEKLHRVVQSYDKSACAIRLPEFVQPSPFVRPAAHWLGGLRRAPLGLQEASLPENLPCPFDVDYQESIAFHPDAEPQLDRRFEKGGFVFYDPCPSTVPGEPVFDDFVSIGEPQEERTLPPDLDRFLEMDQFLSSLFGGPSYSRPAREKLRFFFLSLAVHFAVFSLFLAAPACVLTGLGGISDKPITVRLRETCEINTPDEPSPGSVDSLASMASLARRDPKLEETIRQENEKELPKEVESKDVPGESEPEPRPAEVKPESEPVRVHAREPQDNSVDGPPNDSKNLQDSIASMPSVASPERQGPSKAGDEAQTYKDLILAAIYDAAYYPKAALRNMAHGEAVVCFTINKDGSLANVSIVRHAESQILDDAALKIVRKASSRFPPIPDALVADQVTYQVPIIFKQRS